MAKDINLLSYWMPILRNLKEFKEIAKAEEPELRLILGAIDRTLANMFIETADEYGIKRFEKMMGIYPAEGESLESRRLTVLMQWNNKVPYTDRELENRLNVICGGKDKYKIIRNYNDYEIDITVNVGKKGAFDAVFKLLDEMLPCNLASAVRNNMEATSIANVYMGSLPSISMCHIVTHDINAIVSKESILYSAIANSIVTASEIIHDMSSITDGSLYDAVGNGTATTKIITHEI